MLVRLYVKNYALIKELELGFDKGLTIITGETGAGKSILLGALGLVLGQRADSTALLDKSSKCIVESTFQLKNGDFAEFFEKNDLDYTDTCLMRREISVNGRSRAFINDSPVTLDLMKDLGFLLIDIHSQHQTLMLGKNQFQLAIIDSFANHSNILTSYSTAYVEYREKEKEYAVLKSRSDKDKADLEYYNHQLNLLDEAKLQAGEERDLEQERDLLSHAGEVHEALSAFVNTMNNDDNSLVPSLNELKRMLERIKGYLPEAEDYHTRLSSVIIELNDLSNEVERKSGTIEADPGRLEFLTSRLDTLYTLMQKHRTETVAQLIEKREELRQKVDEISFGDERIMKLEKDLLNLKNLLLSLAKEISENRHNVTPSVKSKMSELLNALGMPNGKFEISLLHLEDFTLNGLDQADFLFSANKQTDPENLGKVASGGELSRVMLSLKSLLTDNKSLPTIFFDEIDAGVSGEVATRVGQILAGMGSRMQVINITHLPQVAAHGNMHYYVYKEDDSNSTITHIKLLDKKERLNEVARLLSGNEITKASLDNARDLISMV